MKSILKSIRDEFQRSPIGTLGAIAAVLALFVANPEILNVTNTATAEADPTVRNSAGLITWILLYVAVCYLFAKWGSVVIRQRYSTGFLTYPVFSVIVVTLGVYLASVYLGGFPLLEKVHPTGGNVSHSWVGLGTPAFCFILVSVWVFVSGGLMLPDAISHDKRYDKETSFVGWLITAMIFMQLTGWIYSHALLFGLVEPIPYGLGVPVDESATDPLDSLRE